MKHQLLATAALGALGSVVMAHASSDDNILCRRTAPTHEMQERMK